MERIPVTAGGKLKMSDELRNLKTVERPKVVRDIEEARAHGDLKENAEYHAAKEKQGFIEGRIQLLEDHLSRCEVIDPAKLGTNKVVFGVTVKLYDMDTDKQFKYKIVGDIESDAPNGLISINSPMARALIGKEIGDVALVQAPGGQRELEVVEISVE